MNVPKSILSYAVNYNYDEIVEFLRDGAGQITGDGYYDILASYLRLRGFLNYKEGLNYQAQLDWFDQFCADVDVANKLDFFSSIYGQLKGLKALHAPIPTALNMWGGVFSSTGKWGGLGTNDRDLITDMKTAKGNGTAYASASGLTLSGSSFKYKEWLYRTSTLSAFGLLLDTRNTSTGLNGYVVGVQNSGNSTPHGLIFAIVDADALEINLIYPTVPLNQLTLIEIDWDLNDSLPTVKYNGVVQTVSQELTNDPVTEFTPNDTAFFGNRWDSGAGKLSNIEYNHLFIGDENGFNHGWIMLDTAGTESADVIGTSHATWTSPNWVTPTRLGENWINQVGYYKSGSTYIPARNQLVDAKGNDLTAGSAKYPAQLKSSVIKGNGTTSLVVVEGITQTINATDYFKVRARFTVSASGTNEMLVDTRDASLNGGFIIFKDNSDNIFIRVQVDASNYFTVIFTPTIRTGATYELWLKTNEVKLFENGSEITANSSVPTGTMSDISNSNDWVLMQRSDKGNTTVTVQSISDLEVIDSNWMPLQEGAGTVGYDVIDTTVAITYTNITRATVSWCSHYNSVYGFYNDGTRNIPALLSDITVDVEDNPITIDLCQFNDTFAELDLDPENTVELNQLPHDYQLGDSVTGLYNKDNSGAEYKLIYIPYVPAGTELTKINNYIGV